MQNIPAQSYAQDTSEIFKQPNDSGRNFESNRPHHRQRRLLKRDPPGQQCVYIPPGDHRIESYRLSTFMCFHNDQISIFDLAESGFYYTGYKDRTKCFSCGYDVEDWKPDDSPFDKMFHEEDCPMNNGLELRNVMSSRTHFRNVMKQFTNLNATCTTKNQAATGHQQPSSVMNLPNSGAAAATITPNPNASQELPTLKMARVHDQQHKEDLQRLDLCKEEDRRKTFAKWPTYPAPYLPRDLAQEGFFYLGNLDRVQCFSCSGILRNWAPSDDVKKQHQSHFPTCRLHNGTDPRNINMTAEQRIRADNEDAEKLSMLLPNGDVSEPPDPSPEEQRYLEEKLPCNNPTTPHMSTYRERVESFKRWPTGKTKATVEQLAKAGLFYLGESDKTKCFYCNGGLQNWDYSDEPWSEHAKWFPGCEFVNRCKGLRFVRQIADAHPNLNRPSIRSEIRVGNIPDFQDSLLREQATSSKGETSTKIVKEAATGIAQHTENLDEERHEQPTTSNAAETSLLDAFREARDAMVCKSCKTKKSDNLFLPCGHVVSCSSCASKAKRCMACSSLITENMKIYRS